MNRRARAGAVSFLAWLALSFADATAECTKYSLLQESGVTNGHLYRQWRCSADIGLGGCANCPAEDAEEFGTVVQSAAASWASESSSYSIVPLANVQWVDYQWPSNFVDGRCPGGMNINTIDSDGYITENIIYVNNWNFGISWSAVPYSGYYDFESILIHEMGHALGLRVRDLRWISIVKPLTFCIVATPAARFSQTVSYRTSPRLALMATLLRRSQA